MLIAQGANQAINALQQPNAEGTLDFYQAAQNQLPGIDSSVTSAGDGFGAYLSTIFGGVMIVAALLVLLYLIWGAIEWISSAGDKGKVEKARNKITQAIIGIIVLASTVAIFNVMQTFLGIRVLNFGGSGGNSQNGSGTSSQNTCAGGVPIGGYRNDGGAGGYCTNGGSARVQCHAADSHLSYPHFDPCSCSTGNQVTGYDFGSC